MKEETKRKAAAVASAFNQTEQWSITAAYELAYSVLTDANWHSLARKLKAAKEEETAKDESLLVAIAGENWEEGEA